MRTSTKAALLLTLVMAVVPGVTFAAPPNDSREFRSDREGPIAGAIKHIKRVIVRILEQPAVPIPSTPR
jgi:hypothetical protein